MRIKCMLIALFLACSVASCTVTTNANETAHVSPSPLAATDGELVEALSSPSPAASTPTPSPHPGTLSPTAAPSSSPIASMEPDYASATPAPLPLPDTTQIKEVDLIDSRYELAIAGDNYYEHQRVAVADFDNDGQTEKAILIANATVVDGETVWDDGHVWQLYFEEPTGEQTHAFVRFQQLARVEAMVAERESDQGPSIILLEHNPFYLGVYEVIYNAPGDVKAVELLYRTSFQGSNTMFVPPTPSE